MGEETLEYCYHLASELREFGFYTDMTYENKSIGAQFKIAQRKNASYAIIIGENEMNSYQFQVKNLQTQTQETVEYSKLIDYLNEKINIMEE